MIPGARQGLVVVPRRPSCGLGRQFLSVALQLDQVIKGVDAAQLPTCAPCSVR
jgi:hypothetical protein